MQQPKVKRYSILKEEKEKILNIQSIIGMLALQREGLQRSIDITLMMARQRLAIKDSEAPEGYVRDVSFDMEKYELVVTDSPKEAAADPKAN